MRWFGVANGEMMEDLERARWRCSGVTPGHGMEEGVCTQPKDGRPRGGCRGLKWWGCHGYYRMEDGRVADEVGDEMME